MSIQNIQVGDTVPIELQVADGATDQYPKAIVYDQDSIQLTTVDLSHDNQGNYSGTPYTMPDKIFVKIVYIVYSDAPRTIENIKYERDMEVFYKVDWETLVNDQVSDVLKIDIITEMVPGALPVSPTFEQVLNYLYRKLRNLNTVNATVDTVFADDDTTELFKAPINDDSITFTKSKYISGT